MGLGWEGDGVLGRMPGGHLDEMHHGRQGLAGVWLVWCLGPGGGIKRLREEPSPLPELSGVAIVSPPARLITGFQLHPRQLMAAPGPESGPGYPSPGPAPPLGALCLTPGYLRILEPIWTAQGPNLCLPLFSQVLQGGQDMARRMVCQ